MIINRIVIAQHERGLVLRDKQIHEILMPGIYWRLNFRNKIQVLDSKNAEVTQDVILGLLDSTADGDQQLLK